MLRFGGVVRRRPPLGNHKTMRTEILGHITTARNPAMLSPVKSFQIGNWNRTAKERISGSHSRMTGILGVASADTDVVGIRTGWRLQTRLLVTDRVGLRQSSHHPLVLGRMDLRLVPTESKVRKYMERFLFVLSFNIAPWFQLNELLFI